MILGVCGKLAKRTSLSADTWRVLFVIFTLLGGAGILAYLICWLILKLN